jgi:universal stress protein E
MPAPQLRKIFCVIDPTTNNQRALVRAVEVARQVTGTTVHAYVCFSLPGGLPADRRDAYHEAEHSRHRAWLGEVLATIADDGVEITTEIECHDDWRKALVEAANRSGADLVIRASTRRTALQRRVLKTTDWTLLRESVCPVLFVKSEEAGPLETVLAAVNIRAKDEPHQRLTELVLDYARAVARLTGAELHAANAYSGSRNFVHPPDLAKFVGIDRSKTHVRDSSPDELIGAVAQMLGHPLVVIGAIPRTGMTGGVVGNTAERILDHIQSDILCIVQRPD